LIAHDFSSVGELAVAGKAKVNGEDAAFAYVTDYQTDCLMLSKIAWKGPLGTSVGITSIYLTAGHNLAMSAYEATTTTLTEYLLVATYATSLDLSTTKTYKLIDKTLPSTDYVIPARGITYFDGSSIAVLVSTNYLRYVTIATAHL
jgi:hypothetical protein